MAKGGSKGTKYSSQAAVRRAGSALKMTSAKGSHSKLTTLKHGKK